MRKNIAASLIICLAVSTVTFAILWIAEKNSKDDMKEFAQAQAIHAYTHFAAYRDNGDMDRYWYGVASFFAFEEAYRSVFQGTNQSSNYLILDEVYGYLIGDPEKSQTYVADIVEIMELFSKDIEDLNGHARMLDLRNKYLYEEE